MSFWNFNPGTLEEIEFRMIQNSSTALIAYENGELDMNQDVPREQLDRLKTLPDLQTSSAIATYYLEFNCQKPPLDNPDVRRALAMAINRTGIVKGVTRAGEKIAFTLCPPQLYTPSPGNSFLMPYPDAKVVAPPNCAKTEVATSSWQVPKTASTATTSAPHVKLHAKTHNPKPPPKPKQPDHPPFSTPKVQKTIKKDG